jgi:hypothetical protein
VLQSCFAAMGRADTRSGCFNPGSFGQQVCTRGLLRAKHSIRLHRSLPSLLGTTLATERGAPSSSTEPARGFALAVAFAPGLPAPVDA